MQQQRRPEHAAAAASACSSSPRQRRRHHHHPILSLATLIALVALLTSSPLCYYASAVPVLFPVTHPMLWSTPWNWMLNTAVSPATLSTNHIGAYLKFSVRSTSQISLLIDTSMLPAGGPWYILRFYIDSDITNANLTDSSGEPSQGINGRWYVPADTINVVQNGITYQALQVPTPLDSTVPHTVMILLRSTDNSYDRFYSSLTNTMLFRMLYIMLDGDGGQTLIAPTLRQRRMLFYWDDAGEGVNTEATGLTRAIDQNDVTHTFAFVVARTLQAEISTVTFRGLAWLTNGAGNVPWFYNNNATALNTRAGYAPAYPVWSFVAVNQSRLVNGTFMPQPDYIFTGLGMSDVAGGSPTANLGASVTGWLAAVRAAAPTARIFLCIPIGGHIGTLLRTTFATVVDSLTSLIDLGSEAARGLVITSMFGETPVPSISYDCVHPIWLRSVQIGNMMSIRVQQALGWM